MARGKATIMLDRDKVAEAKRLVGDASTSDVLERALDHLIHAATLRHDVAAYADQPLTDDELLVAELPVEFDLADDDVDYDALYGGQP